MVSEFVDSEEFTRACVVLELAEVQDGHPQMFAAVRDPVPLHFLPAEASVG